MPILLSLPFTCYVGLRDAETQQEVTKITFGGYDRVPATFALAADGIAILNTAALQFPMAARAWGLVDAVLLWTGPDIADPGSQIGELAMDAAVDIPMYARARIPPAGLAVMQVIMPRPFGIGPYGTEQYGTWNTLTGSSGAVLEITFGGVAHVCEPGTWTPGPFKVAA